MTDTVRPGWESEAADLLDAHCDLEDGPDLHK